MGATVSIYLDERVKKEDEVYPVKIRVTHGGERLYIGITKEKINEKLDKSILVKYRYDGKGNYSIKKELFEEIINNKKSGQFKDLQTIFKGIEIDAQNKADKMNPFSFEGFKKLMTSSRSKQNNVFLLFDEIIQNLKKEGRVGTSESYKISSNSLKKFSGTCNVPFEYFSFDRLQKYQKWMRENGNSDTSTGIYLRSLRAIFNEAIDRDITTHYPFPRGTKEEKNKFRIPKGSGRKIALNRIELKKIFDYQLAENHPYSFYLDCWKLMFLLGGINPTDLCRLKEGNIKDGFVFYSRQKTMRTSNEKKTIQVPYSETVSSLLDKWKVKQKESGSFLLPVIDNSMDAMKCKAKVAQFVKMVNTTMKAVAKELGIEKNVTTYVSRHTLATQLMQSGASVKFIGDQLGHHNSATTESYLEGFTDDQINEAYSQITKF